MTHEVKPSGSDSTRQLCFVVGPIGHDGSLERRHSDLLLNTVIKNALQSEEFSYVVKRADEDTDPGLIGDRVVSDIINAELVVADLTNLNPNVFYELGIRHSTEKPTIHIAQSGTVLPFDIISHRTIFVDLSDWNSIEQARFRLAEAARAISAPGYRVSNPITQANASFEMRESHDPKDRLLAELQERLSSIESAINPHRENGSKNNLEILNNYGRHALSLWRQGRNVEDILRMLSSRAKHDENDVEPISITPEDLLLLRINNELLGFKLGKRAS
jgi:hypothetical protein